MSVLLVPDYDLHSKLGDLVGYFNSLIEDNQSLADDLEESGKEVEALIKEKTELSVKLKQQEDTIEELQTLLKNSRNELWKVNEKYNVLKNELGDIEK